MKCKLTDSELRFAMEQYANGVRPVVIAQKLNVPVATIHYHRRKCGLKPLLSTPTESEVFSVDFDTLIFELSEAVKKLQEISDYLRDAEVRMGKEN